MIKYLINLAVILLPALAHDPEIDAKCSRTIDPATSPRQLLLDLEI